MKKKEKKLAKEYAFRFDGSKEMFMNVLNPFHEEGRRVFYFDNYIVHVKHEGVHFGVERAGHSGGYWFISNFEEEDNQIEFRGTLQFIGPEDDRTNAQKFFDNFLVVLFCIFAFPIILVLWVIGGVSGIINKLRKKPKPLTTEEKLFDLMVNRLGCQRV